MNNIGNKIKEIRKSKGWSQEELAGHSKVNLRTIQRIENNESEPRGTTLKLICEAFDVNVEDILDYGKQEDQTFLSIFHLSVLTLLVIPLGNIIIPLILWVNKKDKIVRVKETGSNLLNFQIIWTVVTTVVTVGFALARIQHWHGVKFLIYVLIFLYAINIILPILFAITSKRNSRNNFYPNPIKMLK